MDEREQEWREDEGVDKGKAAATLALPIGNLVQCTPFLFGEIQVLVHCMNAVCSDDSNENDSIKHLSMSAV